MPWPKGKPKSAETRERMRVSARRRSLEVELYRERARREANERAAGEVSLREAIAKS